VLRLLDELTKIREEIDVVDKEIVETLAKRFKLVEKISRIKSKYGLPLEDAKRERVVLDRVKVLAESLGVNPSLAEEIFKTIIKACKKHEKLLMGS